MKASILSVFFFLDFEYLGLIPESTRNLSNVLWGVWKHIFLVKTGELEVFWITSSSVDQVVTLTTPSPTLICIPPTTTLFLLTLTPWDLFCPHSSRECSNRWRNGFEWPRRVSHSLETGVSFTPHIKLLYLHAMRGAEARHGDNGRTNDGLWIVRANTGATTQCCAAD